MKWAISRSLPSAGPPLCTAAAGCWFGGPKRRRPRFRGCLGRFGICGLVEDGGGGSSSMQGVQMTLGVHWPEACPPFPSKRGSHLSWTISAKSVAHVLELEGDPARDPLVECQDMTYLAKDKTYKYRQGNKRLFHLRCCGGSFPAPLVPGIRLPQAAFDGLLHRGRTHWSPLNNINFP